MNWSFMNLRVVIFKSVLLERRLSKIGSSESIKTLKSTQNDLIRKVRILGVTGEVCLNKNSICEGAIFILQVRCKAKSF